MAERLWFQNPESTEHACASCEQSLADAIKARDQFLKEQPSLQAYQAEIDRTLQNVIGYEERMAVLGVMMEAKIYELRDAAAELQSVTRKFDSLLKSQLGEGGIEMEKGAARLRLVKS